MFEKEDFQSWFKENTPKEGLSENTTFTKQFVIDAWNDGYYTGYNKANEWHYVKDGDLPKDDKNFRSYVVAYYGAKGSSANGKPCWEELCYDTENKRWVDKDTLDDIPYVNQEGIVIAWKEIVLPKEIKENDGIQVYINRQSFGVYKTFTC